jgi:hypothetical protein
MGQASHPSKAHLDAQAISRFKKERVLLQLTEDQFRDLVVRPLMLRMGLEDGRDLCGPDEEGKDCVFFKADPIRKRIMYAVQTKRGPINMTRKATENVTEAQAQLRTALETSVSLVMPREKRKPDCVILCASGKINKAAREHIQAEINDTRLAFMGADEVINELDEHYPEYWYGIEADKFPYYQRLKEDLARQSETVSIVEQSDAGLAVCPITDESFVQLYLNRMTTVEKKVGRETETVPDVEEIPIYGVLKGKPRLVMITGDAGSGKSTSLRRLAYSVATKALKDESASMVPVMMRCTEVEKSPHRLIEQAADATSRFTPDRGASFNATDLAAGLVVILLDALDEVSSDEGRAGVIRKVKEFHQTHPTCLVVVTSRRTPFVKETSELTGFTTYQISSFSMEQAERLVTTIVRDKALPAVDMNETLRRIRDVHGVELNPLLVTIFVAISDYNRQDIPANITELFKKYTEMMLGRWDKQKGLAQQIHAPIKDFLLRSLAYLMHTRGDVSIPVAECRALFERELASRDHRADVEVLFHEIVYRSGLLRIVGEDIEFRHMLLQEFFAGRAIPSAEHLTGLVSQPWWTKAIVFYFGENPDKCDSINGLLGRIPTADPVGVYTAATAVGLATQACYLSKVDDKLVSFRWVLRTLAEVKDRFIEQGGGDPEKRFPELMVYLGYYLHARDAVASHLMADLAASLVEAKPQTDEEQAVNETALFWALVGLIEVGQLPAVEDLLKKFRPADRRHFLRIHMGCYLLANIRITTAGTKDVARRICHKLTTKVRPYAYQIIKDLKSMLIEVRRGKLEIFHDTPPRELAAPGPEVEDDREDTESG